MFLSNFMGNWHDSTQNCFEALLLLLFTAVTAKKGTVFDRWRFGWGGKGGGCLRGWKEEEEAGEMDKKAMLCGKTAFYASFLAKSRNYCMEDKSRRVLFFYVLRTVGYFVTCAKFTLPAFDVICSISLKKCPFPDSQLI